MRTGTIRAFVIESTTWQGRLSLRVDPKDPTATPLYKAITDTFKAGDELVIRLAPKRRKARK